MQVVRLKDEAEPSAKHRQFRLPRAVQLAPHQPYRTVLHRAQAADQGQHRGLARAGGPHQNGEAAARQGQVDVEERLFARLARAEPVVQPRSRRSSRIHVHALLRTGRPDRPPQAAAWR